MRPITTILLMACACTLGACAASSPVRDGASRSTAVTPFLMFQDGRAEEAMNFYADTFPGGRVVSVERFPAEAGMPEGAVQVAEVEIAGQRVRATDSPPVHEFNFTPSTSLFVDCSSEAQFDALVAELSEGGEIMMPVGDYGFSEKFTFFSDRFGVSWQINLPAEAAPVEPV